MVEPRQIRPLHGCSATQLRTPPYSRPGRQTAAKFAHHTLPSRTAVQLWLLPCPHPQQVMAKHCKAQATRPQGCGVVLATPLRGPPCSRSRWQTGAEASKPHLQPRTPTRLCSGVLGPPPAAGPAGGPWRRLAIPRSLHGWAGISLMRAPPAAGPAGGSWWRTAARGAPRRAA